MIIAKPVLDVLYIHQFFVLYSFSNIFLVKKRFFSQRVDRFCKRWKCFLEAERHLLYRPVRPRETDPHEGGERGPARSLVFGRTAHGRGKNKKRHNAEIFSGARLSSQMRQVNAGLSGQVQQANSRSSSNAVLLSKILNVSASRTRGRHRVNEGLHNPPSLSVRIRGMENPLGRSDER